MSLLKSHGILQSAENHLNFTFALKMEDQTVLQVKVTMANFKFVKSYP